MIENSIDFVSFFKILFSMMNITIRKNSVEYKYLRLFDISRFSIQY